MRKGDVKVRLPEQPFLILTMLLEHPGEVVTRQEIRQKLWPNDTWKGKRRATGLLGVAQASRLLLVGSRTPDRQNKSAGRMPSPQRARRPSYERPYRSTNYWTGLFRLRTG